MKRLLFLILSILLCAALASCGVKTIPADPLPPTTFATVETTAAPAATEPVAETTATTADVEVIPSAERLAEKLVELFDTMQSNMLAAIDSSSISDPVEYALTKASYENLKWDFGTITYSSATNATVKLDITMLDEKAVFDRYIVAIAQSDEKDADGSVMASVLEGELPLIYKSIDLKLIKKSGSWGLDDNPEFDELFSIGTIN